MISIRHRILVGPVKFPCLERNLNIFLRLVRSTVGNKNLHLPVSAASTVLLRSEGRVPVPIPVSPLLFCLDTCTEPPSCSMETTVRPQELNPARTHAPNSHYCSRRHRTRLTHSSPGSRWKFPHNPVPSSAGWSSPSGDSRTGDILLSKAYRPTQRARGGELIP